MRPSAAIWYAYPLLALPSVLSSGCDVPDQPASRITVRDSAGIVLVENHADPGSLSAYLEVDPNPLVELGVLSGNPDQEFGEFPFARLMGDDRVLIADDLAREVRIFDLSGTLLWRMGREGGGPEEFRRFDQVQVTAGDTVRVFDRGNRRITIVAPPSRTVLSLLLADRQVYQARTLRFTPAGALLYSSRVSGTAAPSSSRWTLSRDSVSLHLADRDGAHLTAFGTFLIREMLSQTHTEGTVSRGYQAAVPFGRTTEWTASTEGVYVGTNGVFEITVFDFGGRLRRIIRWPSLPVTLTEEEIQELKASMLAQVGDSSEDPFPVDDIFDRAFLPASKPAFRGLLLDGAGHLLVGRYEPPPAMSSLWYVFQESGELLGSVVFPADSQVRDIQGELVLLQIPHPMDVPVFRVHRLVRQGSR